MQKNRFLRHVGCLSVGAGSALASFLVYSNEPAKIGTQSAVDASLGAGSLLTTMASLGAVIVTILVFAAFAKRYSLNRSSTGNELRTVASLAVGPKERLLVVEFRDRQLVLGATAQQITLLLDLDKPLQAETPAPGAVSAAGASPTADALVKKWVSKLTDRAK